MCFISHPDYIRCRILAGYEAESKHCTGNLSIYFAETKSFSQKYTDLENYLSYDESLRAKKFYSKENRETYITCHAILRLVLADYINENPHELLFIKGKNNKPGLGNKIFFNLTHTKEAFAFAVSKEVYVGIDLENISQNIDIHSIAKTYFSKQEQDYILKLNEDSKERFFKLWTRKEALLKALGAGIIDNLAQLVVSGVDNLIDRESFDGIILDHDFSELFLYSRKVSNYFLSIAVPGKTSINYIQLNSDNIVSYLK